MTKIVLQKNHNTGCTQKVKEALPSKTVEHFRNTREDQYLVSLGGFFNV